MLLFPLEKKLLRLRMEKQRELLIHCSCSWEMHGQNHILGNMQPSQLLGFVLRSSGLLQGVWIMCMVTATLSAPFSQHHMLLNKHSGSQCQVFLIMLLAAMFLYETVHFSLSLYINISLIKSFTAGDFHFPNTILIMISCFNNNCC